MAGRFAKFGDKKREAYLDALRQGMRRGKAAESVGISGQTVRDYIKAYPDFQIEIDQAEIDACDIIEDSLWEKAKEGNTTAILVWLFNRSNGRWIDKRNTVDTASSVQDKRVDAIEERLKKEESVRRPEEDSTVLPK